MKSVTFHKECPYVAKYGCDIMLIEMQILMLNLYIRYSQKKILSKVWIMHTWIMYILINYILLPSGHRWCYDTVDIKSNNTISYYM